MYREKIKKYRRMKSSLFRISFLAFIQLLVYIVLIFCVVSSCQIQKSSTTKNTIAEPSVHKKVLLIGFDGIRGDAFDVLLKNGKLPNMAKLVKHGNYTMATTSDLTGSWGGWSDVLRGVHRDKHEAGYWGKEGMQNVAPSADHPDFVNTPDLFTRLESHDHSIRTAVFNTWSGLDKILDKPDYRAFVNYETHGDSIMTLAAGKYLREYNPDMTYFYQGDTDIAGHNNGFGPNSIASELADFSKKYRESIIKADKNTGKVLQAIMEREQVKSGRESWLIIFTSDHGATEGGHSQNRVAERYVPFIISGVNLEIYEPYPQINDIVINPKNIDIIPTIFTYLGIPGNSDAWSGLAGHNLYYPTNKNAIAKKLAFNKNLIFNGDAEYDVGFNGHDETIYIGGPKDAERDWDTEGLYWDQSISGWDDWTLSPSKNSMTTVFYGAGEKIMYPKHSNQSNWNRGQNFFAGGIDGESIMTQSIDLSGVLNKSENSLSFELSAYLGGFEDLEDTASFIAIFMDKYGKEINRTVIDGPNASERNNETLLILKKVTKKVPTGSVKVKFIVETKGKHGYSDNLSFKLKN